ncbi:hypothetical protein ACEPAF_1398 [Sanghuangporus sanghuang]
MDQRLLLILFRNLLDLCRRWGRRSLHWLLRIISALSPRLLNGSRFIAQAGDKERYESKQPLDSTTFNEVQQDGHSNAPERPVVFMACSTTPRKPPPARSYTRHTSLESYHMGPTCTSPTSTLRELPGSISPSPMSPRNPTLCLSDEDGNTTCELPVPPGTTVAEPANIVALPEKPFKSFLPSMTSRYDRNITIPNYVGPWVFEPLETLTVYDELDVPYWRHYIQPEGQPYFLRVSGRFHYLTEENLDNHSTLSEAEHFINTFERRVENYKSLPTNVEVMFELHKDYWSYYMVDLDHRRLFWIDECIIDDSVLPGKFGVEYREHFRYVFEFEYWQHIDYFPNHRPLQNGLLDELLGILLQQHIDVETSLSSTSGFNGNELKSAIGSVKKLRSLQTSENALPYVVQASARMMAVLANERFFNFFGFNGARLSPYQSVRGQNGKKRRSPLIALLSPALFYAPEVHLVALEKVWVDNVIKVRHWKDFQGKIERDWEQFILYATVLVNANVAFLAIPSIVSDDLGPGLLTSPAGVVSQISIIASLASIIIGLLLVRQMRIGTKDSGEDYLAFVESRTHPQLGLETLAILYSLPYALLIWGMATFLASIAVACFYSMDGDITLTERIIYGIVWAFVLIFILWTIQTGWEKKRRRSSSLPSSPAPDNDSETESTVHSDTASGPELTRRKASKNLGPNLHGSISEADEIELDAIDSDARSVRSQRSMRSVRSRLTASSTLASSIGHPWRLRNARNRSERAEGPKRSGFLSLSWPWWVRSAPMAERDRGGLPKFETRPTV